MRMARASPQAPREPRHTAPQADQPDWLLAMRGMFDEPGDRMTDMMTGLNTRINSLEDVLVMSASRTQQRMRGLENSLRSKPNDKQEDKFGSELRREYRQHAEDEHNWNSQH